MARTRSLLRGAAAALIAVAVARSRSHASQDGRTGRATSGCSCHASSPSSSVTVTITGPQTVAPQSTHQYTVTVSGGPTSPDGGFDLLESAGTLVAGANNQVVGSEVTHSNPDHRTWTFSWTAPSITGSQNFVAVALAANGNGSSSGDSYNFYGGASGTKFAINVSNSAGVEGTATAWLAPPNPNPCRREAEIAFSLATPEPVRVEVLDVSGRRVATLVSGMRPAGRQTARWDRRGDDGTRAASGLYFVRLVSATEQFNTRLLVAD